MKTFVKFFIPLFIAISILLSSFNVRAENVKWKYYATAEDSTKRYYDPQSIVFTSQNIGRVWEKVTVSETSGYRTKEIRVLREIDCFRNVYRTLEMLIEYIDGSEQEKSYPDAKWVDITSSTWLETLREVVCTKK
jgi:hypothetical protein